MTNDVKTPRYLEPSEIELMEYIEATERTHPPTIFIPHIYIKTETMRSLLETLEKTRRALAEADDLLIPYAVEYDENDGPCVFGGSEYHEKDVCHACQWHERTAALLSGFSGDTSKEERGG